MSLAMIKEIILGGFHFFFFFLLLPGKMITQIYIFFSVSFKDVAQKYVNAARARP